jgi:hypothetical protein
MKTLYICPEALIGNCLRNISSSFVIAKYYNFDNVIIDLNHNNGIREKELVVIITLLYEFCSTDCTGKYNKISYREIGNIEGYNFTGSNYNLIGEGRVFLENYKEDTIGITGMIFNIIPGNMSDYDFIQEKIHVYKNIVKFPQYLKDNVENFNKIHNLTNCIGVHIRYTDNLGDASKYGFNTHFDVFVEKLFTLDNETILICSDNNDILNYFKDNKINNNHIIFADQCVCIDNTEQSFIQPLYEMMLLSNTKRIIGSTASTFSYEVAYFKGTDIELYEKQKETNKYVWNLYELSKYR